MGLDCACCGQSPATRPYNLCDKCYFDPQLHRKYRLKAADDNKTLKEANQEFADGFEFDTQGCHTQHVGWDPTAPLGEHTTITVEPSLMKDAMVVYRLPRYNNEYFRRAHGFIDLDRPLKIDFQHDAMSAQEFLVMDRKTGLEIPFVARVDEATGEYVQFKHEKVELPNNEHYWRQVRDSDGLINTDRTKHRGNVICVRKPFTKDRRPLKVMAPHYDDVNYAVALHDVVKIGTGVYRMKHQLFNERDLYKFIDNQIETIIVRDCRRLIADEYYLSYALKDKPDLVEPEF